MAIGANEVPEPGGGEQWPRYENPTTVGTRDHELPTGEDSNDRMRFDIFKDLLAALKDAGILRAVIPRDSSDLRVEFLPFVGIAPSRLEELYSILQRRDRPDGSVSRRVSWNLDSSAPLRAPILPVDLLERDELMASRLIREQRIVDSCPDLRAYFGERDHDHVMNKYLERNYDHV